MCLYSYCECFAAGLYCIEPCSCLDCFNKPIHEDKVLEARRQIELRNPLAFAPKVIRSTDPALELGVRSYPWDCSQWVYLASKSSQSILCIALFLRRDAPCNIMLPKFVRFRDVVALLQIFHEYLIFLTLHALHSFMQDETNKTPASARHKKGCNCKRSSCLKKYCECFQVAFYLCIISVCCVLNYWY